MKRSHIIGVFEDLNKLKQRGIYFSGKLGEGLYKEWYKTGQLFRICNFKDGKYDGVYKSWYDDGEEWSHLLYDNGKIIKDFRQ